MSLVDVIGLGVIAAAVAFGGYHYREVHLPDFAMIQAEVLFDKCMRECIEVCAANGIDHGVCVCDHCRKYLEVE